MAQRTSRGGSSGVSTALTVGAALLLTGGCAVYTPPYALRATAAPLTEGAEAPNTLTVHLAAIAEIEAGERLTVSPPVAVRGGVLALSGPRFTVTVPPGTVVRIDGNGDLTLRGLDTVTADLKAGGIEARDVGTADLRTASGGVGVYGATGQVRATTGSGPVTLTGLRTGEVTGITGAGPVTAVFAVPPASADLRTLTGTVLVTVPGDRAYAVNATSGRSTVTTAVTTDKGSNFHITAGSGDGPVTVTGG